MFHLRNVRALYAGLALASAGCVAPVSSPFDEDDLAIPVEEAAFEAVNGISAECFWSHAVQGYLRGLASGPIANAAGLMPPPSGVASSCYKAIEDTVKCALPSGVSVTNPANNAAYAGGIGLAAGWRSAPLSDGNQRRWVTACVTLLVNSYGSSHPILLVGNNPSLLDNASQNEAYPFDSYSLFGDLFSSQSPLNGTTPAFTAYACSENDLDSECSGGHDEVQSRSCDGAGGLCGITYVGPCSSACSANGPYWSCSAFGYSQVVRGQWVGPACMP